MKDKRINEIIDEVYEETDNRKWRKTRLEFDKRRTKLVIKKY